MRDKRSNLWTASMALALALAAAGTGRAADASPAELALERFKALEGTWKAKSTKGWDGEISYRVIAGGSAVLQLSEIDPHAGTTMATLYHLDGDRLMLTHYCVAGNQPRMAATEIGAGGREVEFAFVDATNLASREQGHMDRAVFRFDDDDHYSSRWTWYQDGEERWMEEVELERLR